MATSRRLQSGVNVRDPEANDAQSSSQTPAAALGPLFALAPDAILVTDRDSRFVAANPAALALLGYAEPELLRLTVGDVVAAGPDWARDELARFPARGEWQGEVELRTKSGKCVVAE